MKSKKIVESLNYAIMGIIESIKRERNMQIHFIIGCLVLAFSFYSDLSRGEMILVIFAISFVIISEMINTAIECTLDALIDYYDPLVKAAKDVVAGAVLVAAINSVIVGYIIFWDKVKPITENIIDRILNSSPHTIFSILIVVTFITLVIKIANGKGTPLQGGMPSGHSAIAFSIATIIAYYAKGALVALLGFILAFIVAQSRVDSNIHSILEVILGSILGFLLTQIGRAHV